ncbi:uncharacterized protein BX663DRAFT_517073 [Cokeromyces recurvatus]|uniref:uncharacterized protein n=1 Tax=Cokeromyces recurvatus TaxID=90255 RepID=UPI00221F18F4|nr:uncharacterized protein BX663DRAFT_517073 [Cokeromyces recurvatus]KAI7900625.1 hypothetical protein BX663DRAFT_517073 [Cokeromyces recurvatus]
MHICMYKVICLTIVGYGHIKSIYFISLTHLYETYIQNSRLKIILMIAATLYIHCL